MAKKETGGNRDLCGLLFMLRRILHRSRTVKKSNEKFDKNLIKEDYSLIKYLCKATFWPSDEKRQTET